MSQIITIGREFGSGGRELGKRLAEQLQIAYYDSEIITEIAKKTKLAETYIQQVVERSPTSFFPITVGRSFYANPVLEQNNKIYVEQSNIIEEMAEKSDCVIVGRCADYILRSREPLRLFVYAEMDFKMRRCRTKGPEHEHFNDKELKQHILEMDKNRDKYYQFYTGKKRGDRLNYDLCINTTNVSIKELASAVSKLVRNQ